MKYELLIENEWGTRFVSDENENDRERVKRHYVLNAVIIETLLKNKEREHDYEVYYIRNSALVKMYNDWQILLSLNRYLQVLIIFLYVHTIQKI